MQEHKFGSCLTEDDVLLKLVDELNLYGPVSGELSVRDVYNFLQ